VAVVAMAASLLLALVRVAVPARAARIRL